MKRSLSLLLALAAMGSAAQNARVENVRAAQRPRSNVVEVFYDLVAPEGGVYDVSLALVGDGIEPPLSTIGGDVGADVIPGRNKRIEWDAGADWAQHVGSNFVATVTATRSDSGTGPSAGMVRIPGGTNSGTVPNQVLYRSGHYSLTVESFYMDKTEVTYAHWKRVYNWAVAHGYSFDNAGSGKGGNHPVHTVSWYDCVKWCNARSEMEGRTPAYRVGGEVYRAGQSSPDMDTYGREYLDCNGYRLPTSAEWDYAARGGLHDYLFPWGNTISHAKANYTALDYSWENGSTKGYHPCYNDGTDPYTAPVASFTANRYGLYDMTGNVSEWTMNTSRSSRVCWGGSWESSGNSIQLGYGIACSPSSAWSNVGFRSVRRR